MTQRTVRIVITDENGERCDLTFRRSDVPGFAIAATNRTDPEGPWIRLPMLVDSIVAKRVAEFVTQCATDLQEKPQ